MTFLTLLAATALAAPVEVDRYSGSIQGWTQDSQQFVWTEEDRVMVLSGRTGTVTEADNFEAFKKRHPMAKVVASRTSPDGKATAEMKIVTSPAANAGWADNTWRPAATELVELRVVRDGVSSVSVNWRAGAYTVSPFWSPNGLRVAWVVNPSDRMSMDGTTDCMVEIGGGGGPKIHLLAEKSILAEGTKKVGAALEAAGYPPLFVGAAKKARESSVVYAVKGKEAIAAKIAAAVPGGATVEKLDWATQADVVVAVGKSALKGGK
jgi:hypothetical protein